MVLILLRRSAVSAAVFVGVSAGGFGQTSNWVDFTEDTTNRLVGDFLNTTYDLFNLGDDEMDQVACDFDGNGDIDIAICLKANAYTNGGRANILLMNFSGILYDMTRTQAPDFLINQSNSRDIAACDVDGDGDQDLIVVNTFLEQPQLYVNQGGVAGSWLGFIEATNWFTTESGANAFNPGLNSCSVACGDVNGDGAIDLFIGTYLHSGTHIDSRLLINLGTGRFQDETSARLGAGSNHLYADDNVTGNTLIDMNEDLALDLVVTGNFAGGHTIAYNDGLGMFDCLHSPIITPIPNCSAISCIPYMHEVLDANNDGINDLYIVTDNEDGTIYGLGAVTQGPCLQYSPTVTFPVDARRTYDVGGNLKSLDIDNDGYQDLGICDLDITTAAAGCNGLGFALLQNQQLATGRPLFADPNNLITLPWNATGTWDFDGIDLNSDGCLDLVLTTCSGIRVFVQDCP